MVYVERVEGHHALRYATNSRRSPVHRSSAGKVLAAFNPAMLEARLRAGWGRAPGTRSWFPNCSSPSCTGFASAATRSVDETEVGLSSLAVPVHVPDGRTGGRSHLHGRADEACRR